MLVFGHRGSRVPGPENTVVAVDAALAGGADGVEIDVRRDPSGVLRCSHDPLTGGEPALAELLDVARGRGRVVCEIKNLPGEPDFDAPAEGVAHALVQALTDRAAVHAGPAGPGDDIVVSGFNWLSIEVVRAADIAPTAFLTPPGVALRAAVAYAADAGHAEVHPHLSMVTAEEVETAHAAGLLVVAWTVTSVAELPALAAAGVDGVICDDPVGVLAALART